MPVTVYLLYRTTGHRRYAVRDRSRVDSGFPPITLISDGSLRAAAGVVSGRWARDYSEQELNLERMLFTIQL
jgi:hypothetical protein